MNGSRREFLTRIAKATAYAAPAVVTLSAPGRLLAQENFTSTKGGMGVGMGMDPMGMGMVADFAPDAGGATAPWAVAPPGSIPPGGE